MSLCSVAYISYYGMRLRRWVDWPLLHVHQHLNKRVNVVCTFQHYMVTRPGQDPISQNFNSCSAKPPLWFVETASLSYIIIFVICTNSLRFLMNGVKHFFQMLHDHIMWIKFQWMSHFDRYIKFCKGQCCHPLAFAGLKWYPCIDLQ
jgi:hypothetical protein